MKTSKSNKGILQNRRGFSLIEVLLGISVFMIGMLGVTALNISSLKSNTFSGNLSEATLLASAKIEELMATDFDDIEDGGDGQSDGVNQDENNDGIDDDDDTDPGNDKDGISNFGLDDFGDDADYKEDTLGKNGIYTLYWNVAENEPISVSPQRTKVINVIVEWYVKSEPRRISMTTVRMKEE